MTFDAFSLARNTAVVTGAGSGIGRAIALAFAALNSRRVGKAKRAHL